MKIKSRMKSKARPNLTIVGWENGTRINRTRVLRMSLAEAVMCDRLGVSLESYARELLKERGASK